MKIKDLLEDGTSGGTTSAMVASVPGGRASKGKGKRAKVNLLGFVVPESNKKESTIIKRVQP